MRSSWLEGLPLLGEEHLKVVLSKVPWPSKWAWEPLSALPHRALQSSRDNVQRWQRR